MIILKSWLDDWIDLSNIEDDTISEALESLGFEIESTNKITPNYKNIVVGKVVEIYPHNNADKLRVTQVDVGSNTYEIVCGAWNFDIGAVVPVALPKSYINDDFLIEKREIRGVVSNGMICSAKELGLWDEHEGILILDDSIAPGTNFSSTYISNDTSWEIGITPNRGDCMSHLGVARELSNYFDLKIINNEYKVKSSIENILRTNSGKIVECNSYASVEIENFKIKDSPFYIRYRLSQVGTRVINNVVDLTNYILYDIGQPLHAFDRDKIYGTVSVRKGKANEKILTLDNQSRSINSDDLIITDNDKPIALAGVMGGLETEVTESTKNLLIESAYFDKVSIMNTSRKLNLISDASIRFERGIDFNIQEKALKRFLEIFSSNQDIKFSRPLIDDKKNIKNKSVSFSDKEIYKILGTKIDNRFVSKTLENLDIEHSIVEDKITFISPSWRYDLERPIDVIEEIAKHYGFNNFDSTLPIGNNRNKLGDYWNSKSFLSTQLRANDYQEIQSLSFVDNESNKRFNPEKKYVEVFNPIDTNNKYLRSNLFSSLLNIYKSNLEKNNISAKYFEINTVFDKASHPEYKEIPNQIYSLGVLTPSNVTNIDLRGDDLKYDIYYLKNLISTLIGEFDVKPIEKPGFHNRISYLILKNNKQIGYFGQLSYELMDILNIDDSIYLIELYIEKLDNDAKETSNFIPLAQYPFIKFDLSFTVPIDFVAGDLVSLVKSNLNKNENKIEIFDDYVTEKSRNLGIRISTRNYDRTYSEEETRDILDMLVKKIQDKFNVELNKS
ncbi:MAG: phenylalanine--tRNA ligase subunit beta [Candidatus Actinomarinales bacterium]|nr:MAG: phenylalanine--tRNA ligase subunit beta [Candidatus Actinomarinales bacterium]